MDLRELYRGCRTYRRFRNEPVPEETISKMLENVRVATSSRNGQMLRYIVVRDPEAVKALRPMVKFAGALPPEIGTPREDEWPTAFVSISVEGAETPFTGIDVGIACSVLCASAYEDGIGSCIMGAINKPAITEYLQIPADQKLWLVIALGKPAHKSTIVDVPESGSLAYYVDENRDYYVPKRKLEEIVDFR